MNIKTQTVPPLLGSTRQPVEVVGSWSHKRRQPGRDAGVCEDGKVIITAFVSLPSCKGAQGVFAGTSLPSLDPHNHAVR